MYCLQGSPAGCASMPPAWHVRIKLQPRVRIQTFAANSRRIISRTSTGRARLRVRRELPRKDSSDGNNAGDSKDAEKHPEQRPQPVAQDTTPLQPDGSSDSNAADSKVAKEPNTRKSVSKRRLSEAELLKELNSAPGSTTSMATALLQAFDGDSWGTDDIDGFARVKSETDPIPAPRSRTQTRQTASTSDMQALSVDRNGQVRQAFASCVPDGVQVVGAMQPKRKLVVQPLYASRNPEVLAALKLMKTSYITSSTPSSNPNSAFTEPAYHPDASSTSTSQQGNVNKKQSEGLTEDAASDLHMHMHPAKSSSSKQPSSTSYLGDPEPGKGWVSELETAGWHFKQSPTGETFLERSKGQTPSQTSPSNNNSNHSSHKKTIVQGDARVSPATAGLLTGHQIQPTAPQPGTRQQGVSGLPKSQVPKPQARSQVSTPTITSGSPAVLTPSLSAHSKLARALHSLKTPEQVLDTICLLFPIWSTAGCRLAAPTVLAILDVDLQTSGTAAGNRLGVAPTPYDAAQALHAVARTAKRSGMSQAQRMQLCTEPSVIGLLEALRTRPPRLSPDQEASPALAKSLIALYSAAAKAWWITQPPASPVKAAKQSKQGTAKQVPLQTPYVNGYTTHDAPQGTVQLTPQGPAIDSSSVAGHSNSSEDTNTSQAPMSVGPDSQYQQLLAQYLKPSPEDEVLKGVQRMRHQTVVSALWAMSVLAGPVLWQIEMEAMLSVAGAGATSWECSPGEAGDVAWALATARHWTPQIPRLARAVAAAGGVQCLAPEESCKLLWGLATLNHAQGIAALLPAGEWAWYTPGKGGGDINDYTPTQLAMVCWSLAVGGCALHPAFKPAWHCLLAKAHLIDHNQTATMVQIWQVALELRLSTNDEGITAHAQSSDAVAVVVDAAMHSYRQQLGFQQCQTDEPSASRAVTAAEALLRKAHAVFIASGKAVSAGKVGRAAAAAAQIHSSYQRQLGNALVALRQMHVVEDVSSGYAVDLTLPHMRVAIEADGPSHFSRVPGPGGVTSWPLGATALKHRHLKAMGWALISINNQEWDAAPSPAARQALLSRRINKAVQERMEAQLEAPVTQQ